MSETHAVRIPDIGDIEEVEVIELLVAEGDRVARDDGLLTLESDKASMDVPAPRAGVVRNLQVAVGDMVSEGMVILELEAEATEAEATEDEAAEDEATEDEATEAPPPEPAASALPEGADLHAEVVVLGAGPGGYTAAFRAADLGRKVVLVERHASLGGVCLNVGCIPSKALLHAARVIDEVEAFADNGLRFGEPEIDRERLAAWKQEVVGKLTGGLAKLAKRRDVTVLTGTARLASPRSLEVETEDGTQTVSFDHAVLAAGSRPIELPDVSIDDPRVMDSTAALELEEIPERLLVVGGGIIGLEMATIYAGLGSRVTVVELTDALMPGTDKDLVRPLAKRLESRLEAIHLETRVTGVEAGDDALEVSLEGEDAPDRAAFDRVLVAVGRRPNGDRIGAEAAGVEVDEKGFVPVDEQMRTNVAHIFAIGDLARMPLLAHKASHEGKVAAEVACGEKSAFDARAIPSVAYTDPEVAWVGLTETEAKARDVAYEKGTFPWAANGRSLGQGRDEGMTKILFDPETRRVLGAGVVGPNAGELIGELALALEMDCEAADLGLTIHPHPTLSETVMMAAEDFEGTLTELYKPKRKKRDKKG